jgi:hypothetical protein
MVFNSHNIGAQMTITVSIKNVYGNQTIYPVCNTAKKFANLTGTKTLTVYAIEQIKALGYTVQVEQVKL